MKNAKKFAALTFLLIFPVFLIWFLRTFGENKFSIPVFHQDATAITSEFCSPQEGQHYIPAFNFVNKEGEFLSESHLSGKLTVVSFFNSHCQESCQRLNNELLRLQGNFETEPAVQLLSVSTDPERDTPAELKAYTEEKGLSKPKWEFVTGEKNAVEQLIRCGFVLPLISSSAAIATPANLQLVLVDGQRRIRGYYTSERKEIDRLITEIKILLEER
ncbi:SCO family protein [Nafulsella turpanensis]|uniref:SCO family protein n=1 Tax=Nafulsella turpanensis TaxID=1265690 RepID=UPI00035EA88B|nr:SCO family protein [Nafulsella turpanensis]